MSRPITRRDLWWALAVLVAVIGWFTYSQMHPDLGCDPTSKAIRERLRDEAIVAHDTRMAHAYENALRNCEGK